MSLAEIKKAIKEEKAIIGTELTLKNLKLGKLEKVFVSANCPDSMKKDIEYYSKLANVKVEELKQNNEELGSACKKPFFISVLSIRK